MPLYNPSAGGGGVTPGAAVWIGPWTIYGLQQQTIAFTADAGNCTYEFNGQETSAIASDANAAAYQSAFEALSSVGAGNVVATGTPGAINLVFDESIIPTLIVEGVNTLELEAAPAATSIFIRDATIVNNLHTPAVGDLVIDGMIRVVEAFDFGGAELYFDDGDDWQTSPFTLAEVDSLGPNFSGNSNPAARSAVLRGIDEGVGPGYLPSECKVSVPLRAWLGSHGGLGATTGILKIWICVATPVAP